MEFDLLGWPEDEPTLELDYRTFGYAGKFVMSNTGKAVTTDSGEVIAAVAFSADRTDPSTCWLRYVTVRNDRRGERIGPRLVRFTVDCARDRGFDRVKIAVNNPFAYQALYRAGFAFVGEETGLAELVLAWPGERSPEAYRAGLEVFRERDLSPEEERFLAARRAADPPDILDEAAEET